ncbi:FTR1 family protein [Candida albicans P57072]|uniref:High-affinity iron permease n=5 Tax=Candida TaxID=5475 RepID=A0A1D8PFV0_CANAL|eukprot:XP_715020.1 high-affinity iron permease [Candida albicans SC5314]
MVDVFNVQIFFIVFRESLEAIIVVSVLLAFVKQSMGGSSDPQLKKRLYRQIWLGAGLGVLVCLIIGCAFIGAFYGLGKDIWGNSEDLWEGIFCIIATVLITAMGIPMLRINKMKEKWRVKLAQALIKSPTNKKDRFKLGYLGKKYALFILPFITCLREGLEAVVFVGGVGLNSPATSFPIPVIVGLIAGIVVGALLYYFGSSMSMQIFLIISTCILYLIAAGLFSRGIWYFETNTYNKKTGGDASENGSGPGTYDISKSVWHVNCCNPETDNGWDIFNAILGWQNSATYGSVISYNIYWLFIICVLLLMVYEEKHGHLPFTKNLTLVQLNPMYHIKGKKKLELNKAEKDELFTKLQQQNFGQAAEVDETSSNKLIESKENK